MEPVQVPPLTRHAKNPIYEFNGVRYCLNQLGYYRSCGQSKLALHQEVWKYAHGPIPEGHVIHHRNGTKTDNRLENLECLTDFEHRSHHKSTPEHREQARLAAAKARSMAWKKNPSERNAGIQRLRARLPKATKACQRCGSSYQVSPLEERRSKYCSLRCKTAVCNARRDRRAS